MHGASANYCLLIIIIYKGGGQSFVTSYWGVRLFVTTLDEDGGGGWSKIGIKRVTSFMDGPLKRNMQITVSFNLHYLLRLEHVIQYTCINYSIPLVAKNVLLERKADNII